MAKRFISPERRFAYYLGMIIAGIGILVFLSVFVSALSRSPFDLEIKSFIGRAFGGMGLILVGNLLRMIGARGLAGSGIVLDPQKAREDLEPWSRMGGGMLKDALEESGLQARGAAHASAPGEDFEEKLRKLHKLREDGILTEAEYQKEKKDVLDSL